MGIKWKPKQKSLSLPGSLPPSVLKLFTTTFIGGEIALNRRKTKTSLTCQYDVQLKEQA